jgi:hypothetical protein
VNRVELCWAEIPIAVVHQLTPSPLVFKFCFVFGADLLLWPSMALLRGDIIDAGMQVLGIVQLEISLEVPQFLLLVKEATRVAQRGLRRTKG